jgi:hypothetical protein
MYFFKGFNNGDVYHQGDLSYVFPLVENSGTEANFIHQ